MPFLTSLTSEGDVIPFGLLSYISLGNKALYIICSHHLSSSSGLISSLGIWRLAHCLHELKQKVRPTCWALYISVLITLVLHQDSFLVWEYEDLLIVCMSLNKKLGLPVMLAFVFFLGMFLLLMVVVASNLAPTHKWLMLESFEKTWPQLYASLRCAPYLTILIGESFNDDDFRSHHKQVLFNEAFWVS